MKHFAAKSLAYIAIGFCMAMIISVRSFGQAGPVEVEGTVKSDTAWSGDVLVVGDVLVPEGVTLTIAPGTKVMFSASESSKIEPVFLSMQTEIMVRGTLLAKGERDNPVTFTAAPEDINTKKPERGDWGGLIFDGPGSSGSAVSYANFDRGDTPVAAYNSSPSVTGCRFTDCRYGIVCMGRSSPRVTNTVITGCEYGVVSARGARPALTGCSVEKNERDFIIRD
jgi:hypothetical protein